MSTQIKTRITFRILQISRNLFSRFPTKRMNFSYKSWKSGFEFSNIKKNYQFSMTKDSLNLKTLFMNPSNWKVFWQFIEELEKSTNFWLIIVVFLFLFLLKLFHYLSLIFYILKIRTFISLRYLMLIPSPFSYPAERFITSMPKKRKSMDHHLIRLWQCEQAIHS